MRTNTWLSSKYFHCQWTSSDRWHKTSSFTIPENACFNWGTSTHQQILFFLENSFNWACGTHQKPGNFQRYQWQHQHLVMSAPLATVRPQGRMWMSRFWAAFWVKHQRFQVPRIQVLTYVSSIEYGCCEGIPTTMLQQPRHLAYIISGYLKLLVSRQECKNPKGVARDHKEITG